MKKENQELVVLKQLPIIEEQLIKVSEEIDDKLEIAKSLVCSEENKNTVKQLRTSFMKEFDDWEEKRKDIKNKIINPYNQFEEAYKKYIGDKYKKADQELKNKIDTVEAEQKAKKEKELQEYFKEYKTSHNLDFLNFEKLNITVSLSSSLKALKEQIKEFIDRVLEDIQIINAQSDADEIMVEYKQTLNASNAITTVLNRKEMLKREQEIKEKQVEEREKIQKDLSKFEDMSKEVLEAPKEEIIGCKELKLHSCTFTIKATMEQLKALKEYFNENGIEIIK